MLRSNIKTERSDFNKIKDKDHISEVWNVIEKNIPVYFEKMNETNNIANLLKANPSFIITSNASDIRKLISHSFEIGMHKFEKEVGKYKNFFSETSMQEFEDEDDPKAFKSALSKKVPVILNGRNSKREMMREWQEKFANSKPADIYAIFFNLIIFMNDYVSEIDLTKFGEINDVIDLNKLFVLNEDDDYNVPGVIGMGIKSTVLFYLNPTYFLAANKSTLYGFYFLSEREHFRLPSQTNEFIMINDMKKRNNNNINTNIPIDQNYWFPYDLFMLYSMRTYRKLKELANKYKYTLDDNNRFIHVNTFMLNIREIESSEIATMTGGDEEDAR